MERAIRGDLQGEPEHEVHPLGRVSFSIEFLSAEADGGSARPEISDEGGETACWAHLLCLDCGAVLDRAQHECR
jgi:hypothetical protein